jgi:hypothetical protein
VIDVDSITDTPWHRYDWTGSFVAVDDCPTTDLTRDDVAVVLAYGETDSMDWDGESAGVVLLHDGRVIAWESNWGPTGSGFCCDAYGGEADIICAWTIAGAHMRISERARELLVWPQEVECAIHEIVTHLAIARDAEQEGRAEQAAAIRKQAIAAARGEP